MRRWMSSPIVTWTDTPSARKSFWPLRSLMRRPLVRVAVAFIVVPPRGSGRSWHESGSGLLQVEACHRLVVGEHQGLRGREAAGGTKRAEGAREIGFAEGVREIGFAENVREIAVARC